MEKSFFEQHKAPLWKIKINTPKSEQFSEVELNNIFQTQSHFIVHQFVGDLKQKTPLSCWDLAILSRCFAQGVQKGNKNFPKIDSYFLYLELGKVATIIVNQFNDLKSDDLLKFYTSCPEEAALLLFHLGQLARVQFEMPPLSTQVLNDSGLLLHQGLIQSGINASSNFLSGLGLLAQYNNKEFKLDALTAKLLLKALAERPVDRLNSKDISKFFYGLRILAGSNCLEHFCPDLSHIRALLSAQVSLAFANKAMPKNCIEKNIFLTVCCLTALIKNNFLSDLELKTMVLEVAGLELEIDETEKESLLPLESKSKLPKAETLQHGRHRSFSASESSPRVEPNQNSDENRPFVWSI